VYGLKHQKEKRSMDHFAGLDVSVKETSVCIVDDTGKIVREVKVASEPEALLAVLKNPAYHFKWIGLEAGPLSQWLYSALAEAGLPVICVETRHMKAALKAQINKTDRNDARGIAQMMRVGLYRPVHVKTLRSQKLRMLLTHRKLLQSKAIAIDNDLRATLRNFGLKVGVVGTVKFEARIKELVENLPDLSILVDPLLIVRRVLREQIGVLLGWRVVGANSLNRPRRRATLGSLLRSRDRNMTEVVYLKPGEKPPRRKSSSFLLIVCRRRGGEVVEFGADRALKTIRTSRSKLPKHSAVYSDHKNLKFMSRAPQLERKRRRGPKRWPRPTIEDLQRENEINTRIGDKLRSTVRALVQLDAAPQSGVSSRVLGIITVSAAPGDDYGQRRALEMLNRATSELASGGAVQLSPMRIVLPSLLAAWKRDR
jgi:hypothetical protein